MAEGELDLPVLSLDHELICTHEHMFVIDSITKPEVYAYPVLAEGALCILQLGQSAQICMHCQFWLTAPGCCTTVPSILTENVPIVRGMPGGCSSVHMGHIFTVTVWPICCVSCFVDGDEHLPWK